MTSAGEARQASTQADSPTPADHTASGSYLPTNRLASWGLGIALVARYLAA